MDTDVPFILILKNRTQMVRIPLDVHAKVKSTQDTDHATDYICDTLDVNRDDIVQVCCFCTDCQHSYLMSLAQTINTMRGMISIAHPAIILSYLNNFPSGDKTALTARADLHSNMLAILIEAMPRLQKFEEAVDNF